MRLKVSGGALLVSILSRLKLGAKLGLSSGIGIVLVAGMLTNGILSNQTTQLSLEVEDTQISIAHDLLMAAESLRALQVATSKMQLAKDPAALDTGLQAAEMQFKEANGCSCGTRT
jgi:methyl-accepting chemotaxis protein